MERSDNQRTRRQAHRDDEGGLAGASVTTRSKSFAKSARDPFFDNAKYLAILLVVTGHLVEPHRDSPLVHALYFFVYLFHMPLFILLTGYLSRNFTFGAGKARKLIATLAVPYLIFETAYSLPSLILYGEFKLTILEPYFLTWFLLSLFLWRLSTPVWQQLRWPLLVALGLSLLTGTSALPDELSMNRTFGLLPFYVLGLMLRPEHFQLLRRPYMRLAGACTLGIGLAAALLVHTSVPTEWIRWRHSNAQIGVDDLTGTAIRLALLVAGAVLVAAFLAITPARHTWFSGLGSATMYAYLLHGFVVKIAERLELGLFLSTVVGLVAATLLCTPPVRRLFHWAVEPRMSWAFTSLRRPAA
ncbi:acyltransferase family protein [Nonomuraea sp. B12E4]|uniref:acyltransferase family protein n=1 Tax=Nonomuraea sp. B12E4 TaxID=3153564 RepID=UPI00325E919E